MEGEKHAHRVHGHVGQMGKLYKDRRDLMKNNVMNGIVNGINGIGSFPAASVVANSGGGYDDCGGDFGNILIYTGQGGGAGKGDQEFTRYNLSLYYNHKDFVPVRVIRGFNLNTKYAPAEGYRYDGLYWVTAMWREQEGQTSIIKFRLVRDPWCDSTPIPVVEGFEPVERPRITRDDYVVMAATWRQGGSVSSTRQRTPQRRHAIQVQRRYPRRNYNQGSDSDDEDERTVCSYDQNYDLRYLPECWKKVIYSGHHPRYDRYTKQDLLHGLNITADSYPLEYHSSFIAFNQWESLEPQFLWKMNWRKDEWTEFPIKSHPILYSLDDILKRTQPQATATTHMVKNATILRQKLSSTLKEQCRPHSFKLNRFLDEIQQRGLILVHEIEQWQQQQGWQQQELQQSMDIFIPYGFQKFNSKLSSLSGNNRPPFSFINFTLLINKYCKILERNIALLNLSDFFIFTKDIEEYLVNYSNIRKALLHKLLQERKKLLDLLTNKELVKLYQMQ